MRKVVEAAYISTERNTNHKEGLFRLSRALAKLITTTTRWAFGNLSAGDSPTGAGMT